ncbi:MAG: lactonase family protein [Acidobacteria bacterium]|nr:lactonase family protein [Acidobacteriota bacterium]
MKWMTATRFSIAALAAAQFAFGANYLMYVGTYTGNGKSKGIYAFRFDSATGQATPLGVAAEVANPSFVAIHPNGKNLYAVGESQGGAVHAFSIDKASGKLALINTVSAKGNGPCHLNVDKTGRSLIVVNYGSGSTTLLSINADGSLKEAAGAIQHKGTVHLEKRQGGPHAHSVNFAPDNRHAIVADLGLDQLIVYRFDAAAGTIAPNEPPFAKVAPGSGPRHFSFHPSGKRAYVINEISLTTTAFKYNAKKGTLTETQTISTLPPDFNASREGLSTAEILVHPSGKFVYGSNRGHNTIVVYRVKGDKLQHVENAPTQGKTPRNFAIAPGGQVLLAENQASDTIVVFKIDPKTGKLTPTGQTHEVGSPVCIRFLPL